MSKKCGSGIAGQFARPKKGTQQNVYYVAWLRRKGHSEPVSSFENDSRHAAASRARSFKARCEAFDLLIESASSKKSPTSDKEKAADRVAEAFRASIVAEMEAHPVLLAVESLAQRLERGMVRRWRSPWQVMQVLIALEQAFDALERIEHGPGRDPFSPGDGIALSGSPCEPVQILKETKE